MARRRPTIDCYRLDGDHLKQARVVAAGILVHVRATRRGKSTPPALDRALARLTPVLYLWHLLAWKMRGFRRDVDLATTEDQKVVVISDAEICIGDPMTERIERVALTGEPSPLAKGPSDIENAWATGSEHPQLVRPQSKFRHH